MTAWNRLHADSPLGSMTLACKVGLQLLGRLQQQRVVGCVGPALNFLKAGAVPLTVKPHAAQPTLAGGQRHAAQRAVGVKAVPGGHV